MSWVITAQQKIDPDAALYINRVEAADGQALETAVKDAIDAFVRGCKADGIWNAIKASCILAGARTLAGALVPLVGVAPTNNNFASGDYNRKTGLIGNGSNKSINTGRKNNSDPQNSVHHAVYTTSSPTLQTFTGLSPAFVIDSGSMQLDSSGARCRNGTIDAGYSEHSSPGLVGISRSSSSQFVYRNSVVGSITINRSSTTPGNDSVFVFAFPSNNLYTSARLAFYSIGEAVDLALLDARVTALINALAAAIP